MPRIPGPRSPLEIVRLIRAVNANPYQVLTEVQEAYGPVSKIDVRPVVLAVLLLGPEANEYVLSTNPGAFRWREAMKTLTPIEGETSLIVSDGEDHARRRRVVQPAFHKRAVDAQLGMLIDEADRMIDTWSVGAEIDGFRATASVIERGAISALAGPRLRARAHEISARLAPAIEFVNLPPLSQFKLPWPTTRYHRARVGRQAVEAIVDHEIAFRATCGSVHAGDGPDVLQMLIDAEGDTMTRREIHDQIISLMANWDTTSAAMGWALHRLVTEPKVWEHAAAELDRVLGDELPTVDDLGRLTYLDSLVKETLRLHPPSIYSPREVAEPIDYAGYHIPQGAIVLFSPYISGRDATQFPDPEAFRPERWDESRPDHIEPHPYAFVPFGGRSRRCIGFALATLQLKTVITQLVRRTELEPLRAHPPRPQGSVAVRPGDGVPVRVAAVRQRAVIA